MLRLAVASDALTEETVWLPSPNLQQKLQVGGRWMATFRPPSRGQHHRLPRRHCIATLPQAQMVCRELALEVFDGAWSRIAAGKGSVSKDQNRSLRNTSSVCALATAPLAEASSASLSGQMLANQARGSHDASTASASKGPGGGCCSVS